MVNDGVSRVALDGRGPVGGLDAGAAPEASAAAAVPEPDAGRREKKRRFDSPGNGALMHTDILVAEKIGRDEDPAVAGVFRPGRVWMFMAVFAALFTVQAISQAWASYRHGYTWPWGFWILRPAFDAMGSESISAEILETVTESWSLFGIFLFLSLGIFVDHSSRVLPWIMRVSATLSVLSAGGAVGGFLAKILIAEARLRGDYHTPLVERHYFELVDDKYTWSVWAPILLATIGVTGLVLFISILAAANAYPVDEAGEPLADGSAPPIPAWLARLKLPAQGIVALSLAGMLAVRHSEGSATVTCWVFAALLAVVIPTDFRTVVWFQRVRRRAGREDFAAYLLFSEIVMFIILAKMLIGDD